MPLDRDTRRGPRTRVLAVITRRSAHCSLLRTHKPGSLLLLCLARTPMPPAQVNPCSPIAPNPGLPKSTNPYSISRDLDPGMSSSDNISVRLYDTLLGLRRRCARGTSRRLRHEGPRRPCLPSRGRRRHASRRLGNDPPSPTRGQATSDSAPKIQTSIFCTGQILKKSRNTRIPAGTDFQKF